MARRAEGERDTVAECILEAVVVPKERAAEVDRLLAEGEELYGAGHADEAIARWTEVLHLVPDEPRATL